MIVNLQQDRSDGTMSPGKNIQITLVKPKWEYSENFKNEE